MDSPKPTLPECTHGASATGTVDAIGPNTIANGFPLEATTLPDNNYVLTHDRGDKQRISPLVELLRKPETYRDVGVELALLVRTLVADDGKCVGDWDQIGQLVATDGRTVRRWADRLEKMGRLTVKQMSSKRFEIGLVGPHPALVQSVANEESVVGSDMACDAELDRLVGLYRAAKAAGCTVRVKIVETFGDATAD